MPRVDDPFIQLFEASLQELFALRPTLDSRSLALVYCEVLIAYLSSDSSGLSHWVHKLQTRFSEAPSLVSKTRLVHDLALLRLETRERQVTSLSIQRMEDWIARIDQRSRMSGPETNSRSDLEIWKGEIYFVMARAHETRDQNATACALFDAAHRELIQQGCPRKAAKALQNQIAAQSRVEASLNFVQEYQSIIPLARKTKDYGLAGVAAMNISRELEAAGALIASLKYIQRALMLMSRDVGSLHFYLALLHRSHLYLQLNWLPEARLDLETAVLSQHLEIQAALPYLRSLLEDSNTPEVPVHHFKLTHAWRARTLGEDQTRLSTQEDRLIELLAGRARTKEYLISALWNREGDPEALDLRFKRLIARIRSKRPDFVLFGSGKYHLSKRSYVPIPLTSVPGVTYG